MGKKKIATQHCTLIQSKNFANRSRALRDRTSLFIRTAECINILRGMSLISPQTKTTALIMLIIIHQVTMTFW